MTLIRFKLALLASFALTGSFVTLAQNKKRGVQNSPSKLTAVADKNAVKITLETIALPKGFRGHDEVILFKNLDSLVKQNQPAKNNTQRALDGKAVYGKLKTNDLFAFSDYDASPVQEVAARNKSDNGLRYFGNLWRLRNINEFPEPKREQSEGCIGFGTGDIGKALPKVSSREELVTPLATAKTKSEIWSESTFHLSTETPKTNRQDYIGFNINNWCEFYVPSPQTHYDLAFVGEQSISLVNINDNKIARFQRSFFSLEEYDLKKEYGIGFAVWEGDDVVLAENRGNLLTLFIVKLVSPYVATKIFTKQDPIEKKPHLAVQNKLYVKIVGVWLYNLETGEIVSKNAAF